MKNLLFGLLLLASQISLAGYEVDFIVENAPVHAERSISLKQHNLSTAILKQDSAQINDEIKPLQSFNIKISDLKNDISISSEDLCNFLNQPEEEKLKNGLWQYIVFTVKEKNKPDEDVILYWSRLKTSLFANGESKNFVLSAFQRSLPQKSKDGNYKYTIKINFVDKG